MILQSTKTVGTYARVVQRILDSGRSVRRLTPGTANNVTTTLNFFQKASLSYLTKLRVFQ